MKSKPTMFLSMLIAMGLTAWLLYFPITAQEEDEVKTTRFHALSLSGEPKYPAGFKHLDYVNPNAPKGGTMRRFYEGSFNTLNPFTITGRPAVGLTLLVYETLMRSPEDDSVAEYGVIAEEVEVAEDLSFAIFHLRPEARFSDGSPVTSEDVVFSFHLLRDEGLPHYAKYYADVESATAVDPHTVRFDFSGPPNRELPQIMGQIWVLSKAFWENREFGEAIIEPIVSSGPYTIGAIEPGRLIEYKRNPDYWGANLPFNVGRFNFDVFSFKYYRDSDVAYLGFRAAEYDLRPENSSKDWAEKYTDEAFPAVQSGMVRKKLFEHDRPAGMQAFIFNTRKSKFTDRRVRLAICYMFDFEYANNNLFYNQYTRTTSYFANSDFAATGLPSPEELEILEQYRGRIPDEVFTNVYEVPTTDGSGNIRPQMQKAFQLLTEAGWGIQDGALTHTETGEVMEIEFLLNDAGFERVVNPLKENLKRLGIKSTTRTVEPTQYLNRVDEFDYDMIIGTLRQSHSPGNEQRDFWGSETAEQEGSRNYIGIQDTVIDEVIEKIVQAKTRDELITVTRALDRILLWNHFVIPQWHIRADRVVWWDKFGIPEIKPKYYVGYSTWWYDTEKARRVEEFLR